MFFKISSGVDSSSYAAMSIDMPEEILNKLYTAYKESYEENNGIEFDGEEEDGKDVFINMVKNLFSCPDTFIIASNTPYTGCGDFTKMFLTIYYNVLHTISENDYHACGVQENIENTNIDSYILIYDINDMDSPYSPFMVDNNNYPIYSVEQYVVAVALIIISQQFLAFKRYRYTAHGIFN